MSENILSEKSVIEAEAPEQKGEQVDAAASEQRPEPEQRAEAPQPRKGGGVWLALWLLLVTAAGGGGGWYLWQQQQAARQGVSADTQALSQKLDALQRRIDELGQVPQRVAAQSDDLAALKSQLQSLQSEQDSLQSGQQSLEDSVGKLRSDLAGSARVWDVEHIAILMRIANDRLRLEGAVGPSLAALEAADRHLQQLNNPSLLGVRRKLADDINSLRSAPTPDIAGTAFKLEALINGVDGLPVAAGEVVGAETSPAAKEPGWRGALHDIWEKLKSLVVIKRRGDAERPLLSPDQRYFLRQNLRLELAAARVALLRRDPASYQASLRQAQDWIGRYFDDKDSATVAALDELNNLQQTDIAPPLPDISGSLDALQGWLKKQRQLPLPAPEAPAS